jgi:hypothetical protein
VVRREQPDECPGAPAGQVRLTLATLQHDAEPAAQLQVGALARHGNLPARFRGNLQQVCPAT